MFEGFSEKEIELLITIEKDESQLERLSYKKDVFLTEQFLRFARMIVKHENLKDIPETGEFRRTSLVRVHKNIPTYELDYFKFDYTIMAGLYIVADVVFVDKKTLDKFYKKPYEENRIKLGLPDDVLLNASRLVATEYNRPVYALLKKSLLTERYVQFQKDWSYPVW